MSPEQIRGARDVDHRTDIYALSCILFEMLAGRPPFRGSMGEVVGMHQFVDAPSLAELRADVPVELAAVIARALAKDPEVRPASLDELGAVLEPFLSIVAAAPVHSPSSIAVAPTAERVGPSSNEPQASTAVAPKVERAGPSSHEAEASIAVAPTAVPEPVIVPPVAHAPSIVVETRASIAVVPTAGRPSSHETQASFAIASTADLPTRAAPEPSLPQHAAPELAAPEHAAPDRAARAQTRPERAVGEQASFAHAGRVQTPSESARSPRRIAHLLVAVGSLLAVAGIVIAATRARSTTQQAGRDASTTFAVVELDAHDASMTVVDDELAARPQTLDASVAVVDVPIDARLVRSTTQPHVNDASTTIAVVDSPGQSVDAAPMPLEADALRARCREAETAHRWAELLECAGKLRDGGTPRDVIQADAWTDLVIRERNADKQLVELQNGLSAGKLGLAMRALNRIPIESYPRARAEQLFANGEVTIVTNALRELRPLTADCAAYGKELVKRRAEFQQGYVFWLAVVMRLPCRSSAPVVETTRDCDPDHHAEGNALALRGAYREAFAAYRGIVDGCKVDIPEVHAKLVALACRLGDAAVAKQYFGKQPAAARIVVGRLCRDYGVTPDR
jgi:hypothetical protein